MVDGKVALVTGGASGIGLATVRRFAREGARVIVADVNEAAGQAAAAEVGGRFIRIDVGNPAEWSALVAGVRAAVGGIDIAHLNAGVDTGESDIAAITDQQYRRIMGANVDGVVFGIRAIVPAMTERNGGWIVVTASIAGLTPYPLDPIYTLTKHAVVGFVRSLAPPLADRGIRINCLCPAMVDTPLTQGLTAPDGLPLIHPEAIAAAVLDCATGDGTGQAWVCQPGRQPIAYVHRNVPGPRTGSEATPAAVP